jgi:hypothetical protein
MKGRYIRVRCVIIFDNVSYILFVNDKNDGRLKSHWYIKVCVKVFIYSVFCLIKKKAFLLSVCQF